MQQSPKRSTGWTTWDLPTSGQKAQSIFSGKCPTTKQDKISKEIAGFGGRYFSYRYQQTIYKIHAQLPEQHDSVRTKFSCPHASTLLERTGALRMQLGIATVASHMFRHTGCRKKRRALRRSSRARELGERGRLQIIIMGVFVRVVNGNKDAAARYFLRVLRSGADRRRPQAMVFMRPGERRRQRLQAAEHKHEQVKLFQSLNTIFAKRARGF
jgi:hypothetical protein